MKPLLCLLLALFAWPSLLIAETTEDRPPNIVLIFADDVGREVLGCYGGESYKTPNLDQLRADGMKLEHFYSSPVCHPSRVTLMSGRYPVNMGDPEWGYYPTDEASERETLANELKRVGYATAAAGKWHLAMFKKDLDHPQRLGFDESIFFGWHEGPRFHDPYLYKNGQRPDPETKGQYGPELYVKFLKSFMKRHRDKPFFVYYPMALCHAVSDDLNPHPPHGPNGRYMTYGEMVADMDLRVGQMRETIEELGLTDQTLVMFTTDNGTTGHNYIRHEGRKLIREPVVSRINGMELVGKKGTYTDWGMRVPALVSWPGHVETESSSEALIDLSDLLPTFVELAGGDKPSFPLDGKSFAPLLRGEDHESREWIYGEGRRKKGVRTRDWKLISSGQLFDMANDPEEENPIFKKEDTKASAAARLELEAILLNVKRD